MQKNIFPLFIISLGLITVYVFYAVWHTEEPTLKNLTAQTTQITTQTEQKGTNYIDTQLSKYTNIKNKPTVVTTTQVHSANKEEPRASSFVHETPEEVEEQYEEMIPESYSGTLTQAEAAFASMDATVLEMQERIDTPMVETEQTE